MTHVQVSRLRLRRKPFERTDDSFSVIANCQIAVAGFRFKHALICCSSEKMFVRFDHRLRRDRSVTVIDDVLRQAINRAAYDSYVGALAGARG